jgi:ZF-HD class homeobox domain-containing protein
MEFDEHEEQEEDMMEIPTPPPGYESVSNSARPKMGSNHGESTKGGSGGSTTSFRYRECLKNHAVSMGGHAVDGCGEFMAAGEEGTLDALKCAACNCHRNFHRKETDGSSEPLLYRQFSSYYRSAPPPHQAGYHHHFRLATPSHQQQLRQPLALPAASGGGGHSREGEDMSNPSSSGGGGGGGGSSGLKKRFRTKFSQEQKEKLLAFAESVGWRIQKHDEAAVEQFCTDTGLKRHVLKVWMHNNKQTLGKKP